MIIDFHTHVFPDKIAERTLKALQSPPDVVPHTDGTISGILDSMKESGIDKSVILPVNTRPGQFDTITKFAKHINDTYKSLISFGGIHPDDEEIEDKLQYLKDNGFKGIKIHPDYTGTFIDDDRYIRIIAEARRLGLLVMTHSGKDPKYEIIHCPPEKGALMLDRIEELVPDTKPNMIFAHLGGNYQLEDVEQYLVGRQCYIDISCSFSDLWHYSTSSDEDIIRVIRRHGADKMLFATDSPWNDQKETVERFQNLSGLSDTEKELILGKNAERLLALA